MSDARAQVDMTGPWVTQIFVVFGPTLECPLDFVQTGTSLAVSGVCPLIGAISATGMIDPMTGEFDGVGAAGPGCPVLTLTGGEASLDGKTFFVQFACSGGPIPAFGGIYGYRCGNGVVDASVGETCDDGNRDGGDCCSPPDCQYDPPGGFCFADANQCTDDFCDGAGTCTHPDRTGSCDDANQCTSGDECMVGACVGTTLPDGSLCDDFNDCTAESCQSGTCFATNLPDDTACDDFYDCTAGETCLAGECQLGPPRICPPCLRCYEGDGCVDEPYGYACLSSVEDAIQLKNTDPDSAKWKWTALDPLTFADFGDPLTGASYEFCVFDENHDDPATGYPALLFGASVPAGSRWTQTSGGFRFKSADRKLKVRLKTGAAGKAKIVLKAKGPTYGVEYLPPVDTPIGAYLRTAEGVSPPRCFFTYYDSPVTNTPEKYKAENPSP